MRSKTLALIMVAASLLVQTGCAYNSNGNSSTPTPPPCFNLLQPGLMNPVGWGLVTSLTPTLSWSYPGNCQPQGFRVSLSSAQEPQGILGGTASGSASSWSPSTQLHAATEYFWAVQAFNNNTSGPVSATWSFFTGPLCPTSGALQAPWLGIPADGYIYHGGPDTLTLNWSYPDPSCQPVKYTFEVGVGAGGFQSAITGDTYATSNPAPNLKDCTRYYWHVKAISPGVDPNTWNTSDWSTIQTYFVDLHGTCTPEADAMIRGTVWQDQCFVPAGPLPNPLPLGCVLGPGDVVSTNGTYDPGEPGIFGAIVALAQGPCPSNVILREVPTYGPLGTYDFYWLTPGTYCVSVDASDKFNVPVLQPGSWTAPLTQVLLASRTITVAAGQDANNTDFGWWYKFSNGWGDPTSTVYGIVWHDLCAMTPTSNPPPGPLPAGCALDPYGVVHADGIRQPNEPGIPGVTVDIGIGVCPSAGYATAVTDANGYYHFSNLGAGRYCLRIDPDHGGPNESILMPGSWTVGGSGHEGMAFRPIMLSAGSVLPGQDFGWDYDNLPVPTDTPQAQQVSPLWTLTINALCRKGPDKRFDAATSGMAGDTFPILGRDDQDMWYLVRIPTGGRCWFSKSTGTASGDLGGVGIVQSPPLPTNTVPVVNCSEYKTRDACNANSACTWAFTTSGPGYCKLK